MEWGRGREATIMPPKPKNIRRRASAAHEEAVVFTNGGATTNASLAAMISYIDSALAHKN